MNANQGGFFGWVKRLFGGEPPQTRPSQYGPARAQRGAWSAPPISPPVGDRYVLREGRSVAVDAAFDAWTGGDINEMYRALSVRTNFQDRHALLCRLVDATYKRRAEPPMASLCAHTAQTFIDEWPAAMPKLRRAWKGAAVSVPVFQQYATLLAEQGDIDKAVSVCQLAMNSGLHDGTKGGYEGRIARLRKAATRKSC